MAWVRAQNPNHALAAHYFAVLANSFYRSANFHWLYFTPFAQTRLLGSA
jgi:hypothetical protein